MSLYVKSTACFNPIWGGREKNPGFFSFVENFARLALSHLQHIHIHAAFSQNRSLLALQSPPAEQGPRTFLMATGPMAGPEPALTAQPVAGR